MNLSACFKGSSPKAVAKSWFDLPRASLMYSKKAVDRTGLKGLSFTRPMKCRGMFLLIDFKRRVLSRAIKWVYGSQDATTSDACFKEASLSRLAFSVYSF